MQNDKKNVLNFHHQPVVAAVPPAAVGGPTDAASLLRRPASAGAAAAAACCCCSGTDSGCATGVGELNGGSAIVSLLLCLPFPDEPDCPTSHDLLVLLVEKTHNLALNPQGSEKIK